MSELHDRHEEECSQADEPDAGEIEAMVQMAVLMAVRLPNDPAAAARIEKLTMVLHAALTEFRKTA